MKEEEAVKYRVWLSILMIVSMLAGCSFSGKNVGMHTLGEESKDTLGLTPDFSYEVVEQTPNIMVNQIGYYPEGSKLAIFLGNDLSREFTVYEAVTQRKVYTAELKADNVKDQEEDSEKKLYVADFSKLKQCGTYYIYHPELGYSYEFKIEDHIYDELEKKVLEMFGEKTDDTSLLCYQLAALLMTRELYPDQLLEGDKMELLCKEKIEYLLQAQDTVTGNVYADISMAAKIKDMDASQKQQYISLAATAEFAGIMAFYAYEMKEADRNLYKEGLSAAEKAYLTIQNSLDNVGYDAGYFAAAQLYRLTGKAKYAQAIGQYLTMKEEQKSYTEYDFSLFADYAYITAGSGSNLEWSESIMKSIMKKAETISLSSGKNNYYVSDKREYNDIDGKLQDMSNLALVNYIITNHEYTTLQKNYVDYFLGRNSENICFMDDFGSRNAQSEDEKITKKNCGLFYLLLQSTKI